MFMDVTAITHRKDAVFVSFISQVTPSESSVLKKVGYEPMFYRFLKHDLSIKSVVRVSMHEPLTNLRKMLIIQMKNELEVTSVVITHDMVSTNKVADKVAMLYRGKIIEAGPPEDIRKSENPIIQQFITGAASGPIENW